MSTDAPSRTQAEADDISRRHEEPQPKFLTVAEVAARLQISSNTVYQLVECGQLAHYRIGARRRSIRISETDLSDYLTHRWSPADHPKVPQPSQSPTKFKHLQL